MMRHSQATEENPNIKEWTKDYLEKPNADFFSDALAALAGQNVGNGGLMVIGLIGSCDLAGVTMRQAQSVLRWDMRPSLWSRVFLIAEKVKRGTAGLKKAKTLDISLHPRTGVFPKPERNGVSTSTLEDFDDPKLDANVALLAVAMAEKEAATVAERANHPNRDRLRYNLWETLGVWQGYLWAWGQRPNPLREGWPIPSSSFVEYCYEGIGLDLTPGASERNSAPEHIWNAGKWWHEAFAAQNRSMAGYFVLRDKGCSMLSADEGNGD